MYKLVKMTQWVHFLAVTENHAPGDAVLLIVQKALQAATANNVLIGDCTDLLIYYNSNLN